jgi:hypothetical protein
MWESRGSFLCINLRITPGPFMRPRCVPEKVGVNKKGVNKKKYISIRKRFEEKETHQPESVKPKIRGRKLRSVNW